MPDNATTNSTTAEVDDAAHMPFTKFVNDSETAWLRDHPDPNYTHFGNTEIGKVILDQEAKVAADHASGRISDEDYQAFRGLSESRVESMQTHLQEVGKEWGEDLSTWSHDAKETFEQFRAEHPEILEDLKTGNPSIENVATTGHVVVEVLDPMIDPLFDGVHNVLDAVHDELGDTAQQMVDARADQQGVDPAEIEVSQAKVEAARDVFDAEIDKGHEAVDAAQDKAHEGLGQLDNATDAMHDYADQHPGSQVNDVSPHAISDPHIQEAIQQETGVTEA